MSGQRIYVLLRTTNGKCTNVQDSKGELIIWNLTGQQIYVLLRTTNGKRTSVQEILRESSTYGKTNK